MVGSERNRENMDRKCHWVGRPAIQVAYSNPSGGVLAPCNVTNFYYVVPRHPFSADMEPTCGWTVDHSVANTDRPRGL